MAFFVMENVLCTMRDGVRIVLHRSMPSLTVDVRAGSWPEECTRQHFDLAMQCIAECEMRIKTMMAVMQRLVQRDSKRS